MPLNLSRHYVKLCNREDFDDPGVREMLRSVAPDKSEVEQLHRKLWEYGMLASYLDDVEALKEDAQVLAVAAGHEEPLYWLANRVGRVVATDIYGIGGFANREAAATMLTDPASFAPYPYREDHLEVREMDALKLDFPDDSFDIVYSLSSIEHFGGPAATRRAASEMSRVLKPGGHLIIVTECLIRPTLKDNPGVHLMIKYATLGRRARGAKRGKRTIDAMTADEIRRDITDSVSQQLVQPFDTSVSSWSMENLIHWTGAGELSPATGHPYPHIVLQAQGSPWTSAFLAFH